MRSVLPRGLQPRRVTRMLGRLGVKMPGAGAPPETVEFVGLEQGLEDQPEALGVHPGPPTTYERRVRADRIVAEYVQRGGRVEFRANTIVIVKPASRLTRIRRGLLTLLLLPIALLALLLRPGSGTPKAKMNRRLINVDRHGDIVVWKV